MFSGFRKCWDCMAWFLVSERCLLLYEAVMSEWFYTIVLTKLPLFAALDCLVKMVLTFYLWLFKWCRSCCCFYILQRYTVQNTYISSQNGYKCVKIFSTIFQMALLFVIDFFFLMRNVKSLLQNLIRKLIVFVVCMLSLAIWSFCLCFFTAKSLFFIASWSIIVTNVQRVLVTTFKAPATNDVCITD